MAAKASRGLILAIAIINIAIALVAPCAACIGMSMTLGEPKMDVNGREVGPEFRAHIERKVPLAKVMPVLTMSGSCLCAFLLLVGAIGLFLGKSWGRATTLSAAIPFILTFCIHDATQFGLYLPAVNEFLDSQTRDMPAADRSGYKFGTIAAMFFWPCANIIVVIYLGAMAFYLSMTKSLPNNDKPRKQRRRDDEDDDRPRRRRDDEDDDRPRRRRDDEDVD